MIICRKHKLLFIGIPFSASSAISKELIEQYGCEPYLHKHANIPFLLKKKQDIDIWKYEIAAVRRNPVEITFSIFNKLKTNAFNVYTDKKFFVENGGHVSKKQRKIFHRVNTQKWNYEKYIRKVYSFIPYDSYLSENRQFVTIWIDFNKLNEGFSDMIRKAGIEQKRALPLYNPTVKLSKEFYLPEKLIKKVFGPFLVYNRYQEYDLSLPEVGYFNYIKFLLFRKLRSIKWKKEDHRLYSTGRTFLD